ncbi:MAG TPA: uracil phosphoribosyltransferase [Chloroflexota bacterium]|nr:uracil phosphoribosyltransferase [Chloroflexota bacterium]
MTENLTVIQHPLLDDAMSYLRSRDTDTEKFQRYAQVATRILAMEVFHDLPTRPVRINTPLEEMEARRLAQPTIFIPVLRSGLALLDAMSNFLPGSKVGFVGMERNEETAIARSYYSKLPQHLGESMVVILDPMLATGGSALGTLRLLRQSGAHQLRLACIVAAPEGVELLVAEDPSIRIFTCALDRGLNERKYILPGLGDFGDRYFGTAND